MSWLSPPDPSKNHIIARGDHHDGSVTWFFQGDTFEKWNATGCLLWVHGKPGSGKSILCSSIIEEVKARRDAGLGLLAYFYFDFRDTTKQGIRGLLSSLLTQLCTKSDPCYQVLSDLYSTHGAGSQQPDTKSLVQCMKDMLELSGQPAIYFVIDALDECPNDFGVVSPREKVLNFIEDLVELHLPNLRICVASRSEADILDILQPLASYIICLHDEEGQKQDIISYINSVVQSDRKMRNWRAEDRQLVINALTQRADGMFRWVFCQLETLRRCFPMAIRSTLDKLPQSLDETYERTLLGIDKEKQIYAHRLFQCLTVSIRPLRVEELAEVLAVQFDAGRDSEYSTEWRPGNAQQAVLSACSSLITIVNVDGSPVVQFAHFSVREFLTSDRLRISAAGESLSRYHVRLLSAHIVLARASLSVLLSLDAHVDKSAVEKRPLSLYAAQHWVDHAKIEGVSPSIQDLMKRLFDPDRPYFATWVRIYDVDRPWKGFMAMVHPTQPAAEPVYYAALCGFRTLVEHLTLTYSTDINARGGVHGTPLNAAFSKGEDEIALALLQNGANVNAPDGAGESSMHRAAKYGHCTVMKLLLDHQADVNVRIHDGRTPLHLAVQTGQLDSCRLLLKHGADIESRDNYGRVPLHFASQRGHLGILEDLLIHGADPNVQDDHLQTPLHWALLSGFLEIFQSLARHGAALDQMDVDQETPLHLASRLGDHTIGRFLIDQGANTMSNDKNGNLPLHNASQHPRVDLVEMFLEGGVDVNAQNADEETPLDLASGRGNLEVARFLIKQGAEVNGCNKLGWTPLHKAARNGHLDTVQLLIEHGIGVQVQNGIRETPLILASVGGHVEVARFLIEHQADVNSSDDEGWTPLHSASRLGHTDVVRLLLNHGAEVNVRKADLWTPLSLASTHGHLKVAELLLNHGAEANVRNEHQESPLNLASAKGKLEVARLLLDCGSDVNSQDNKGRTPSHSAAQHGHLSLVELLLDSGADVGIRDSSGQTPLDLAHEHMKHDVTSFLQRRSGNVCHGALNLASSEGGLGSGSSEATDLRLDARDSSCDEDSQSLHNALANGHIDDIQNKIQRLLDRGADVNERNGLLETPLEIVSSMDGGLEIAKTLIKYGADVNSRDSFGWTPLHAAARYGHTDVVQLLLDDGADINATQWEGLTALHLASVNGRFEVVQLLLDQGANVHPRDAYGKTASHYASIYGRQTIVQLLSEYDLGE
ncbi:Ankyrin repeat-containing domain protein [Lactarius tabidus]